MVLLRSGDNNVSSMTQYDTGELMMISPHFLLVDVVLFSSYVKALFDNYSIAARSSNSEMTILCAYWDTLIYNN